MTNNVSGKSSGSGGSSYISGHDGCDSTNENGESTGNSVHYSNLKFKDTVMIDGEGYEWTNERLDYIQMQDPQGNYVDGNSGDGYARVTLLEDPSQNNFLKEIQIDKGTITPELNYDDTEYTVKLNPEDTKLTIYGVVEDIKATIEGNGTYDILPGENEIKLKVTAESEDERVYTIKVTREASNNSKPLNITIDGLIESIINVNPIYGKLDPSTFDADVHEYSMIVPSRIKKLTFNVEKGHDYQTVIGDGTQELLAGKNDIEIKVISEDGKNTDTYIYHITRDMSGNCLLESLTIDNVETDMKFDQDTLEYFVIVENEITNLDITAIPEMKEITPVIEENKNLKVGLNDIYIISTAPNGEQLVYIIHAYRKPNGNVFLSSLKVKNGDEELKLDPIYNKVLDTYIVTTTNEVEKVNIEAIPEEATSTITGTGEKTLKTGTNTYEIKVEAQNGTIGTYTVNINRAQSSNNYLKTLVTTAGDFNKDFDKTINEYEITIPAEMENLPLIIEQEDKTATYKVLQNSNFVTGLNTVIIRVTAENGEQRDYKIKVNKEASSNNYLKNIELSSGSLQTKFDKETLKYSVEVENEVQNIEVNGIKEVQSSSITGNGQYALEVGKNIVTLQVTAENGDIRTYEIEITRKLSSNANLLRIDNDRNQIVTKLNDNTYQINVKNEIEDITIEGIPESNMASVTGNGKYKLNIGDNIIKLYVTSQLGTVKEYDVIINRSKSDNAYLSYLFANEGELYEKFEKTKTEYSTKVGEDIEKLTLGIETEDKEATYEVIGNENFVFGENKITIRVTASDGKTTKDYNIVVYRQPNIEKKCDLLSLTVNKGTLSPEFDANTLVYEVELPYEDDSITVSAQSLDNTAKVEGTGTYNLKVGLNVITIKVTEAEGKEKVYQIRITRAKSDNANLKKLDIQNTTMLPEFTSETINYIVETKLSKLEINAVPEETDSTYEIIGNENLNKGINRIIIRVTSPSGKVTKDYTLKVTKTSSDNNNLSYLGVTDYEITPAFNKSTLLYNTYVPSNVKSVYIDAETDDENATITGAGIVNVQDGKNVFEIIVTSESGKSKTYTLIINKGLSDNAYLESLINSQGILTPEFNKLTNEYKIEVENEIENITFNGYPEDSGATVTGNGNYSLKVGDNKIDIVVTSANNTKNIYTINVTRKSPVSAKLANLEVENYKLVPEYNQNTNDYVVTVNNEVTSLNLIVKTLDPNATYFVKGNENFVVGNNKVEIEVTSSDGKQTETYIINVNRQVSSNNYLSYILPSKGTLSPSFNKTTNNYTVTVENDITEINIDADTEDSNATMTGNGNYTLNVGENKVEIEVTSSIGVKRIYTVNVIRKKNNNNYLKDLKAKIGSENIEITPIFNKETLNYNISVPVGTTKIQFFGEAENSLSTISGLGYKTIEQGENIHNIIVTAEDGSTRTYKIVINRPASTVNDLIDIIPSVGSLSPSFTYGTLEYNLVLGNGDSLLSFEVSKQDRFAKVEGIEEQEVPDGKSVRNIVVTAENGDKKTYTVNVERIRTDDARLKSLAVKSFKLDQEFDKDLYEYTLTVPNDKFILTKNEIVAEPLYEDTKIYPDEQIELSVIETNVYSIKTIAPDGFTSQTYKIKITREKSSNSTLLKLAVAGYEITPEFSSDVYQYTLALPKGSNILKAEDVIAIPTDEYATVLKQEDLDLTIQNKTYNIDVTSHDGTTHTNYKILVEIKKSDDNYLQSLSVSNGSLSPEFDTNVVEYMAHLSSREDEITINAVPRDKTAKVISGTGTFKITEDTKKIVMVQAEDSTLRAYIINIKKDPKTETTIEGKITTENIKNKHISKISIYKGNELKYEEDTNEDGTFKIYVVPDTYNIVISKDGYLRYTINNVKISSLDQKITLKEYKLIAGDLVGKDVIKNGKTIVTGDGEIEIDDLVAINDKYGIIINENNKEANEKFDLNGDGVIDKIDRNILKSNYNKKAETIEWRDNNT